MKKLSKKILWMMVLISSCWPSTEEHKHFLDNRDKTQKAVSAWIKDHALYPESYKSISFDEYSESYTDRNGVKKKGSECYSILHTHEILDKDSILKSFTGYFVLDNEFIVNRIEEQKSNISGTSFPPKTEIWINRFGRTANHQDTVLFHQLQKKFTSRFVNELKEGIDQGSIYTKEGIDMKEMEALIDSLERAK
jgi:hypothetical protein